MWHKSKKFLLLVLGIFGTLGISSTLAADLSFRLYKSETTGSYTYGIENAVATATRWDQSLEYQNPTAGTWYFVLTAYDGQESGPSNEVNGTCGDNQDLEFSWSEYSWADQGRLFIKSAATATGAITLGAGTGTITMSK